MSFMIESHFNDRKKGAEVTLEIVTRANVTAVPLLYPEPPHYEIMTMM